MFRSSPAVVDDEELDPRIQVSCFSFLLLIKKTAGNLTPLTSLLFIALGGIRETQHHNR